MATEAQFKEWQRRQKTAMREAKKAKEAAIKAQKKVDRIEGFARKALKK